MLLKRSPFAARLLARFTPLALLVVTTLVGCGSGADDDAPEDCSVAAQNQFAFDLMKSVYLWANETPDIDPLLFDSPAEVMREMRVEQDRWSGAASAQRRATFLEEGKFLGLGYQMVMDSLGRVRLALVHKGSPAEQAGLKRGTQLLSLNGISLARVAEENLWAEALGEEAVGVEVEHTVMELDGTIRSVTIRKDWITIQTVLVSKILELGDRDVGYVFFTGFLGTSNEGLEEAFKSLAGVDDVILDLRYNGGGFVSVAQRLASLTVSRDLAGEPFILTEYNERLSEEDDVVDFQKREAAVGAERVAGIMGPGTASASELVFNGLRPYLDVTLIGASSAGKPVGSNSWARCETAFFPITFRVLNAEREGNYFDGLSPDCEAPDDLGHQLGDPDEARLAASLSMLGSGDCPPQPTGFTSLLEAPGESLQSTPMGTRTIRRGPQHEHGVF